MSPQHVPLLQSVIFPCEACLSTVASSRSWLLNRSARARCGNTSVSQPMLTDHGQKEDRMSIVQGNHSILRNLWSYMKTVAISQGQASCWQRSSHVEAAVTPGDRCLFPQDSAKHKQLVEATADFICQGLLPLRVVDESSFRRLLEITERWFQLPHRTHFTGCSIIATLQFHLWPPYIISWHVIYRDIKECDVT